MKDEGFRLFKKLIYFTSLEISCKKLLSHFNLKVFYSRSKVMLVFLVFRSSGNSSKSTTSRRGKSSCLFCITVHMAS